ncbi:hypothetical protein EYF80_037014 [Liparis tanakae]|uniref:Uncharacterized protein n=1 Tax=Liparis tanakae TaxID=230148 RepID=A0A4Z2GHV4_9TELE|nr:hypothetical protein EYF80_037014 [Liparis tanakae]
MTERGRTSIKGECVVPDCSSKPSVSLLHPAPALLLRERERLCGCVGLKICLTLQSSPLKMLPALGLGSLRAGGELCD